MANNVVVTTRNEYGGERYTQMGGGANLPETPLMQYILFITRQNTTQALKSCHFPRHEAYGEIEYSSTQTSRSGRFTPGNNPDSY